MAENQNVMSSRERYAARLREKYPEKDFSDDEVLFSQINDDYDEFDKELSDLRARDKAMSDLLSNNPRSAAFLVDWQNGEDPIIGMVKKYGEDFIAALEDPEKQEALAAANKEYADRIAKEEEYEALYQKNLDETLAVIDALKEETGMSDEEIDEAMKFLLDIMKDGLLGKFTKESILMAQKAINHDSDVAQAEMEGEVRGKNTKIREHLRKSKAGDGTASISGGSGGGGNARTHMPELGVIDSGYGTQTIWERGGEKRRRAR